MTNNSETPINERVARAIVAIRARFSLVPDRADDAEIDDGLRSGIVMKGTNLWVLIFAIFIASIGLNVNSTAVIIGAMLISPLMGPIMGVGYGAGILDLALIRSALKNLGIATIIALLTSTTYFLISPLTTAQPELLSRTVPSIWDVMIAFFGGLAGIVGVTRKHKSNVIPGVAIATALMPPLCTAGFGLATGTWSFFFGAFYLFTINCVFIAASSALVISAFHVKRKQFVDRRTEVRVRNTIIVVVMLTLLPSLYLAYNLVGEEIFRTRATQFVQEQLELTGTHVNNINIDAKTKRIEVSLIGEVVPQSVLTDVLGRLPRVGLGDARLQIFQTGDQRIDVATLKSSLLSDLYKESQATLAEKERALDTLQMEINGLKANADRFKDIPMELHALYPQINDVLIAEAPSWNAESGQSKQNTVVMNIKSAKRLANADRKKLEEWLRARVKSDTVRLVIEAG
ncbi:MAG: TIGR00341 family protein [Steroidobacteraceae bacterium]